MQRGARKGACDSAAPAAKETLHALDGSGLASTALVLSWGFVRCALVPSCQECLLCLCFLCTTCACAVVPQGSLRMAPRHKPGPLPSRPRVAPGHRPGPQSSRPRLGPLGAAPPLCAGASQGGNAPFAPGAGGIPRNSNHSISRSRSGSTPDPAVRVNTACVHPW